MWSGRRRAATLPASLRRDRGQIQGSSVPLEADQIGDVGAKDESVQREGGESHIPPST